MSGGQATRGEGAPEIVVRAAGYAERPAIVDGEGLHTYRDLMELSGRLASLLLDGRADLGEERVSYLIRPGFRNVAWQWAIWRAGGIAVPHCLDHPPPELAFVLDDATPAAVVCEEGLAGPLRPLVEERGLRLLDAGTDGSGPLRRLPAVAEGSRAMILYTSGTTGRPKGVVHTHRGLRAQIEALVGAWGWSREDRILSVLPLHHVHGLINVVGCALWSGALCEMAPRFAVEATWARLASGELTLFMAVPTIYHRLIEAWEAAPPAERARMSGGCRSLRLMVSGSAALPVPTLESWRSISGHTLLERYGMTEIGMALSNPLRGERRPGHVGSPLPGVEVRLVDESGREVGEGTPGEIQVRGPSVFAEYWHRPEATREAFDAGWFRTGDVAERREGVYRILGRSSVDIIKTGGEKVSALEVEDVLLGHPGVREAAVVGIPDRRWGERVVAVVVAGTPRPDPEELRARCRSMLAVYKVPKEIRFAPALPRNALGKVTKPELVRKVAAVPEAGSALPGSVDGV